MPGHWISDQNSENFLGAKYDHQPNKFIDSMSGNLSIAASQVGVDWKTIAQHVDWSDASKPFTYSVDGTEVKVEFENRYKLGMQKPLAFPVIQIHGPGGSTTIDTSQIQPSLAQDFHRHVAASTDADFVTRVARATNDSELASSLFSGAHSIENRSEVRVAVMNNIEGKLGGELEDRQFLNRLARLSSPELREALVQVNPLPGHIQDVIMNGRNEGVWEKLASNESLMPAHQEVLASDPSESIRTALAKNPGLEEGVKSTLADDSSAAVKGALHESMGSSTSNQERLSSVSVGNFLSSLPEVTQSNKATQSVKMG